MIELTIHNGNIVNSPMVEDGIKLDLERKGFPGKLTFTVIKDAAISFTEWNTVLFEVDGNNMFCGFIFQK